MLLWLTHISLQNIEWMWYNIDMNLKKWSILCLLLPDRGHPEAAEQRHGGADQQNASGPAECHYLFEGGV